MTSLITLALVFGAGAQPSTLPASEPTFCFGSSPPSVPFTAAGLDLFVATGGDDGDDCLTAATACRTVQGAVDKVTALGSSVHIAPGVYLGTVRADGYSSLVGAGAGATILDGGTTPGAVVEDVGALVDLTVRNGGMGVLVTKGTGHSILLERTVVETSAGDGLNVVSAAVIDSTIRGHAGNGIVLTPVTSHQGLRASGSAIYDNGGSGIVRGYYNCSGYIDLLNSTISGNRVGLDSAFDQVSVHQCTIASNPGGGLRSDWGVPHGVGHSILADNGVADCMVLASHGYNIISDASSCTITGGGGTDLIGVDPRLGPLQDNGGPTFTRALLPGSPAIDSGSTVAPDCPAVDQRGEPRPGDGDRDGLAVCDRGAFEVVRPGTLLRNDAVSSILGGADPPLDTIFTGRVSRCSVDVSVSLDAGDRSDCESRAEGEGAREAANGSSDQDDLFVVDFGWPARPTPEPESGLLNDLRRPLVLWQMEFSTPNGLVVLKDETRNGVILLYR